MDKEEVVSTLKLFFNRKSTHYHINMVFLYGSWASGYPRADSDIDLAIVFLAEGKEKIFDLITDISYELGKILKKEINIISISGDFKHPMLYYNAIEFGIPIFIKNPDNYLNLKLEALCQMEDFQIFGTEWQYRVAQSLLRR